LAKVKRKKKKSKLKKWKDQRKKSGRAMKKEVNWLYQGGLPQGQTILRLLVEDFHPFFSHRVRTKNGHRMLTCSGDYDTVMENGFDSENCRICRVAQALEFDGWVPKAQYAWFAWVPDIKEMDSQTDPKIPTLWITGGMIYNDIFSKFIDPRILEEAGEKERVRKTPPLDEMPIIVTKSGKELDTKYSVGEGDLVKEKGKLVSDVKIPKSVRKNATDEALTFEKYIKPKDDDFLDPILKEHEVDLPKVGSSHPMPDDGSEDDEFDAGEFVESGDDVADLSSKEVKEVALHLGVKAKGPKARRKRVALKVEKIRGKN